MKIVSFNTNGIRARAHQLSQLKERYDPDIIGIQETKVQDVDMAAIDPPSAWYAHWECIAGNLGYSETGVSSTHASSFVSKGIGMKVHDGRAI